MSEAALPIGTSIEVQGERHAAPRQRVLSPPWDDEMYPAEDGLPMTDAHYQCRDFRYLVLACELCCAGHPNAYVAGNQFVYYREGDPKAVVSPDVWVAFDVKEPPPATYKTWKQGKAPDFVMEVASPGTWKRDLNTKPGIYESMGVREYFLCDVGGDDLLDEPLLGFRRRQGAFERLSAQLVDGYLTLESEVLGMVFKVRGREIRAYNAATGEPYPSGAEAVAQRDSARRERDAAEQQRDQALARLAELEARLGKRG